MKLGMKFGQKIIQSASDIFGIIYPTQCAGCDSQLSYGKKFVCLKCELNLPYNLIHDEEERFWGRVQLENVFSLLDYKKGNSVRKILHQIKYKDKTLLGEYMGEKIGQGIAKENWSKEIDIIIPLPLHPKKQNIRGYNQATCLAKGIGEVIDVPYPEKIIQRQVANTTQTKKSRYERWSNVEQVFKLRQKSQIANKHILLVDDAITTGATLESCIRSIQQQVDCKISVASLAVAR